MILKIVAFLFLIAGALTAFSAKWAVRRFGLAQKVQVGFEHNMDEDELMKFKVDKSVVNLKLLGMLIALPGLILVLILFR